VDLTFFPAGKTYFWEALDKVWGLIIAGGTAAATDVQCYIILKGAAKSLTPLRFDFQELKLCTYRVSGAIHSTRLQYYIQIMGEDLAYLYSIVKVLKYIFWGRPCIVVLDCQNPKIIKLELVDPSFDIIKYFRKIRL